MTHPTHPTLPTLITEGRRAAAVAALAAIPAVLVIAASRLGPGMTTDSVAYAAAARSFATTGAVDAISGAPLTLFPPGLPAVLGALARIGLDIESTAVVLNVALVVLAVVGTYALASQALDAPTLALVPTAIVSVSTATVMLYSRLWTEPAFCVLTIGLLLVATRAIRRGRLTIASAIGIVATTAAAATVRYVGLALIPVAGLGAALAERHRGTRRMVVVGLLVGIASSASLAAVVARNLSLGAGPAGNRRTHGASLAELGSGSLATLGDYLVPQPLARAAWLVGGLVAVLLAYGAWRVVRSREAGMAILVAFAATYWVMVVAISLQTVVEDVRYRLAAPAMAPMAILATYATRDVIARLRGRRAGLAVARVGVVVALVLAVPVALAQSAAYAWITAHEGHGYNSLTARGSQLDAALRTLPPGTRVATNDPAHAYWLAGLVPLDYDAGRADLSTTDYIALYDVDIPGTSPGTATDPVALAMPVRLVGQYDDGRLFRLRPAD